MATLRSPGLKVKLLVGHTCKVPRKKLNSNELLRRSPVRCAKKEPFKKKIHQHLKDLQGTISFPVFLPVKHNTRQWTRVFFAWKRHGQQLKNKLTETTSQMEVEDIDKPPLLMSFLVASPSVHSFWQ